MKKKTFAPYLTTSLTIIAAIIFFIACNKEATNQTRLNASNTENADAKVSLVAWYTFNGDTKDHSGNGNDVIFNSATPTVGKDGQPNTAYYFDGTESYMQVADDSSLNPKRAVTLFAVIKPMGFYQGQCHGNRIISKGYNDFASDRLDLGYDDAPFYQYQGCDLPVREKYESSYGSYGNGSSATGGRDTTEYIKTNKWYVLVYTYDGTTSKYYINGVLKDSVVASTTFKPSGDPLFIGRNQDPSFPYYFTGVIDEIRIYRTAIDPLTVQQLSNTLLKN
jgi:concanavalin A-like lectin/glucanase superfamily protein